MAFIEDTTLELGVVETARRVLDNGYETKSSTVAAHPPAARHVPLSRSDQVLSLRIPDADSCRVFAADDDRVLRAWGIVSSFLLQALPGPGGALRAAGGASALRLALDALGEALPLADLIERTWTRVRPDWSYVVRFEFMRVRLVDSGRVRLRYETRCELLDENGHVIDTERAHETESLKPARKLISRLARAESRQHALAYPYGRPLD